MIRRRQPATVAVPTPVCSQSEQRDRRRHRLRVVYRGGFVLHDEVDAVVTPLAAELAAEPHPRAYLSHVEQVADAAHAVVSASIGFIAERDGTAKVGHLKDRPGDRTKALRTIADIAPRPPAPVFGDADMSTGAWAAALVDLARPYSAPLAAVLAAALPPDHDRLMGGPSISERLVSELRELDRAARSLAHRPLCLLSQGVPGARRRGPPRAGRTRRARRTRSDAVTSPTKWRAIDFDAPVANPAPGGLFNATVWTEDAGPVRWIEAGVNVRPHNYGGEQAFGIWGAPWCASPEDLTEDDVKQGERPTGLDPFEPMVVWAFDQSDECGPTDPSAVEVRANAQRVLRFQEQIAVERQFATRLWADVTAESITTASAPALAEAVGYIEEQFAETNTLGLIHARPALQPIAARENLLTRTGGAAARTPAGHLWVFGGGYSDVLGDALIATSPTFGWRGEVQVRDALQHEWNRYIAIAERPIVVGYEAVVAAVGIT